MSEGAAAYAFMGLTQQSIQSSQVSQKRVNQTGSMTRHRRPNYSNEDIIDDLRMESQEFVAPDDDESFSDGYQRRQEENLELGEMDLQEDEMSNEEEEEVKRQSESDEEEQYSEEQGIQTGEQNLGFDLMEDDDEIAQELASLSYLENGKEQETYLEQEIEYHELQQQRQMKYGGGDEQQQLEETRDFPQLQDMVSPDIDNQFLAVDQERRHHTFNDTQETSRLFVGCLIRYINPSHKQGTRPKSARNTLSIIQRSNSQIDRLSLPAQVGNKSNNESQVHLFTTHQPSGFLFKLNENAQLTQDVAQQLLSNVEQVPTILHTFGPNVSVFGFDQCINDIQPSSLNSSKLDTDVITFLYQTQGRSMSFKGSLEGTQTTGKLSELAANNFVFLFGQQSSKKGEMLNVIQKDSLLSRFIEGFKDQVRFLRVSMFFMEQEHVLAQKAYNHTTDGKKEVSLELRNSQRQRVALIKKLATLSKKPMSEQECQIRDIKQSSHLVIQINNNIFIDLGGIECLNATSNPLIVQNLTLNFGSVTNEILKLSPYYADHDFQVSEMQELSLFNTYLRAQLTRNSRVAMLCCVQVDDQNKLNPQTVIALDYCHKIKCYFNGITEDEVQTQLCLSTSLTDVKSTLREIGCLFEKLWNVKRSKLKPQTQISQLETMKQQALDISRSCEYQGKSPRSSEVKRIVSILMKEIENGLSISNELVLSQTPTTSRRTSIHRPTASFLRLRHDNKGTRSTSSLTVSNTDVTQKLVPKTHASSIQKIRSGQVQIHSIPTGGQVMKLIAEKKGSSINRRTSSYNSRQSTSQKDVSPARSQSQVRQIVRPSSAQDYQRKSLINDHSELKVDPKLFEDYKQRLQDSIHCDSRDTPQFQQESLGQYGINNSSLYVRTSVASTIKASRHLNSSIQHRANGILSSQYNSIAINATSGILNTNKSDLYCQTSEKKSSLGRNSIGSKKDMKMISSGSKIRNCKGDKQTPTTRRNLMQESIKVLENEGVKEMAHLADQENDSIALNMMRNQLSHKDQRQNHGIYQICEDQQKEISLLKQALEKVESKVSKLKSRSKRQISDFKSQLQEKDRVISSLEFIQKDSQANVARLTTEICESRKQREAEDLHQATIITTIQSMKGMIEEFKQKEKEKEGLLLKLKEKDSKIRHLTKEVASLKQESNSEDQVRTLTEDYRFLQETQSKKIEEVQCKFQTMFEEYKKVMDQNEKLALEKQGFEETVRHLERIKDSFKDQTLDLKHEIKILKSQGGHIKSSIRFEGTDFNRSGLLMNQSSLNDTNASQTSEGTKSREEKQKQKEAVLGDIRNLIHEYKKERRISQQS